jgi:putative component of toxin-antitoxin plasmid stabilization module
MTGIKTTKRNYLFTVQKRVGSNWQRITDAVFSKRQAARECVRELRNVTGSDYRVRKMVIATSTPTKTESAS